MCGFVTIITAPGKAVSGAVLQQMTATLAHRGPDDFGYACVDPSTGSCRTWNSEPPGSEPLSGVLFGFRRLSILDLTSAGHQPMLSDNGSTVLSFNGEIYNFVELKQELESLGVAFRSRCDTEVLLKSYEQWGTQAFSKFNGMWAFTLWDGRNRKVVACRDRFGVKPLYHAAVDGVRIFASEIKAVLAYPGGFRGFNEQNVVDFLSNCLVDHADTTMFRDIESVPAGSYMELSGERATRHQFWTLRVDPARKRQSEGKLIEQFGELLADSVRLRVRSDVPIGTMLSGGLDSTSITALIHEQRRLSGSTIGGRNWQGLQDFHLTFSACWPGWQSNEEAHIDLLCGQLDLSCQKLYPTGEGIADLLPTVMYHLEEPFENPTAVLQYLLMREAREHGVKVILNGHGADEILAGYPGAFVPPYLASLLLSGRPLKYLREKRAFQSTGEWSSRQVGEELRWNVQQWGKRVGLLPDNGTDLAVPQHLSPLNLALWFKFTEKILPMWLRMEDRVSMAWSVESRLPFLDYRLVEFAFNLPDDLKLRNGYTKYVLRQAMKDRLPEEITFDRVKQRFATPYDTWFRGAWRPMLEDLLVGSCKVQPYLDLPRFQNELRAYLAGSDNVLDADTLWRVLSTEIWLRTFSGNTNLQPV